MILVKLNAINSTNSYLKKLSKEADTANWTVVTAEHQTHGRGQMGTIWASEKGKNLICSVLIKINNFKVEDHFYLNCAISLGIHDALSNYDILQLMIKWPNDIMSVNKKLGGILIENTLSGNMINQTVLGIGLNINQNVFPDNLPKAVSMKQLLNKDFDRNIILNQIVASIKMKIDILNQRKFGDLHRAYEQVLFKKNIPQMFENSNQEKFIGKISGISKQGKIIIELENEIKKEFDFKEIKFL